MKDVAPDPSADLESILSDRVQPLVRRILARFRAGGIDIEDADDIASIVNVRILSRLPQGHALERTPIAELEDYVATLTYHLAYDFLRTRHPEYRRLQKRLRFVLRHDPRMALWSSTARDVCGLSEWKGQAARPIATIKSDRLDPHAPGDAMVSVFRAAGAPLFVDDVVHFLFDQWEVHAPRRVDVATLTARDPSPALQAETKQYLRVLWQEVLQLPQAQRAALLLNLRDSEGRNAAALLVLLGVTDLDELAETMGIGCGRLAAIWSQLPLDDLSIGAMLGITRQQVINLRKSARARLARRMHGRGRQ